MGHGRHCWMARLARYSLATLAALHGAAPLEAQVDDLGLAAITQKIEAWTRGVLDTTGIPAISIALVRDNKVAWVGAYGFANVAAAVKATPDTYFSTGSTFKSVTATAVMQLVERGLLTLDTSMNELLGPERAVAGADDVTLRQLLSHHSGLEGPIDRVPLWGREAPMSLDENIAQLRRTQPPGVEKRYCNPCYAVLETIIEKVSGMAYDQYIAENILQPLGIDIASASVPSPQMVEWMAIPYRIADGAPTAVSQVRYSSFAAGDAYLRPVDMARFLVTQLNGGVYGETRILAEASVAEMQRVQFEDSGDGLGILEIELDGHTVIMHGGTIPGFKAVMMGDTAIGAGVYIMSNATQAERAINLLAWYSMTLLWDEDGASRSKELPESRVHSDP